jgi:paraquat-inducible protein A
MRSAEARTTEPQLRECPGCGLIQTVPALAPGTMAQCARCPTTLRRVSAHRPDHLIALAVAALTLLIVMCSAQLMSVQKAGIAHVAGLFSGPEELVDRGMAPLAAVVVFVTVLAPLARLTATVYVLVRSHEASPPRHLRRIFALAVELRPWSMIDVFVFGVFVAYTKLGDLVTIGVLNGLYALLALTFVLVWLDSALDREMVWGRLDPANRPAAPRQAVGRALSCHTCGLVSVPGRTKLAARVAKALCTPASRTASRGPGLW